MFHANFSVALTPSVGEVTSMALQSSLLISESGGVELGGDVVTSETSLSAEVEELASFVLQIVAVEFSWEVVIISVGIIVGGNTLSYDTAE